MMAKKLFIFMLTYMFFNFSLGASETSKQYLIKFKSHVSQKTIDRLFKQIGVEKIKFIKQISVFKIRINNLKLFGNFQKILNDKIIFIEPDYKIKAFNTPNDPLFPDQKGLENINASLAWDMSTGASSVLVAITDTGYSYNHDELKEQVFVNQKEIPGNGIDDDNNGFIDDWHGWDFAGDDNDPTDGHMHGTHVAGIIGAKANNDVGISGVNWNVSILPLQFLTKDGSGDTSDAIDAIVYAADMGARVMNASWGGSQSSQALEDAINYGFEKGMLFVCAAGNDSANSDLVASYPAGHESPGILSIASSDPDGKLSSFSNYGATTVDIVAPGGQILSTVLDNKYGRASGTSMASPMAAGVAALIVSANPALTVLELRNAMLNAVDINGDFEGVVSSSGHINAQKALAQLQNGFQVWPSQITVAVGKSFQFSAYQGQGAVKWTVDDDKIATIDEKGNLKGLSAGEVVVSLTDANGNKATTNKVTVHSTSPIPSAPGCVAQANAGTGAEEGSFNFFSIISFFLPFLMLFLIKIRFLK